MYFRQNAKILHQYSIVVVWSVFFFSLFFFHFQACFKKGREFFELYLSLYYGNRIAHKAKHFLCVVVRLFWITHPTVVVVVGIINKQHSTTNVSCLFTKQSNYFLHICFDFFLFSFATSSILFLLGHILWLQIYPGISSYNYCFCFFREIFRWIFT